MSKSAKKEAEKEVKEKDQQLKPQIKKKDKVKSIEKKKKNQVINDTSPIINFLVDKPTICLTISFILLGLGIGLVFYMGWYETTMKTDRDYLIWDDPMTVNYDKTIAAKQLL